MTDRQDLNAFIQLYLRMGYELEYEGKPWTVEWIDKLLNYYYSGIPLVGLDDSLMLRLGRRPEAIERKVWGVATAYGLKGGKTKVKKYHKPTDKLKDRTGQPWTDRDMHIVHMAVGSQGRSRDAHKTEYLSSILARPVDEVEAFFDACIAAGHFGFIMPARPIAVCEYLNTQMIDRRTLYNELREENTRMQHLLKQEKEKDKNADSE